MIKFVQVVTGEYTYRNKDNEQEFSHAIYGLDEYGEIFKYIPMKKTWIRLEDLDFD